MRITGSINVNIDITIGLDRPSAIVDLKSRSNTMSTVTLTWTDPTTRVDGTALAPTEIASVAIFDTAAPDPTVPIGTVLAGVRTFTTGTLTVGDHTFTAETTDTAGHTAAVSNTTTQTVAPTLAAPSAITDLASTLNP